jgi:hypothetical protein
MTTVMTTVCTWEVLPRDSSAAVIACGVTADPGKARREVELAMANPGAGLGHLVRTAVPGHRPDPAELYRWPPLLEVQQCRRTRDGGYSWQPLCPGTGAAPPAP